MGRSFFTSDTHYFHANIIKYSNRPFTNVDEMNKHMIKAWNEKVQSGDTVYHLGDFGFTNGTDAANIVRRLNGNKILIWGNHDKSLRKDKSFVGMWGSTHEILEITIQGQHIVLFHYPIMSWNRMFHGSWHLHGHCHGNLKYPFNGKVRDMGVDCCPNFAPMSFEEIKEEFSTITEFECLENAGKGNPDIIGVAN